MPTVSGDFLVVARIDGNVVRLMVPAEDEGHAGLQLVMSQHRGATERYRSPGAMSLVTVVWSNVAMLELVSVEKVTDFRAPGQ